MIPIQTWTPMIRCWWIFYDYFVQFSISLFSESFRRIRIRIFATGQHFSNKPIHISDKILCLPRQISDLMWKFRFFHVHLSRLNINQDYFFLGNVAFTEGKVELKSTKRDANGLEKFHLDCSIRLNKETVAISNFQKTFTIATGFNSSHLKPQENIDLHFDTNKIQKNIIDLNVYKKESSSLESYFEVCFI